MRIEDEEQLRNLYGSISPRALQKELTHLEKHSMRFIELSPFATISTYSKQGKVDCSPRGGKAGFARIVNENSIAIADARGNNRLDSLVNIVETGKVGCLFMIPGIDETLRVNGSAYLSIDPEDLKYSSGDKNPPKSVIIIDIEEVYLHCAKAMMRSELWSANALQERNVLPSMSKMISDQVVASGKVDLSNESDVLESQEDMIKRYREQM